MPLAPAPHDDPRSRAQSLAADATLLDLGRAGALFPADFVHRRTLVERLRTARGAMLAVIVAPPGYGKSALIAEWAESDDRRFTWLGAEDDDAGDIATRRVTAALEALDDDEPAVLVIDDGHRLGPDVLQRTVTELWPAARPPGARRDPDARPGHGPRRGGRAPAARRRRA